MNWKNYCKGFAVQKTHCDWEGKCLAIVGALEQIPCKLVHTPKEVEEGWIPSGTVPWVTSILGKEVKPDYFPIFLKNWVSRKIWTEEKWPLSKIFIKPADRHKRFTGFITSGKWRGKKKGPFVCSEIVKFVDEWRYYISYGKVLGGYWYWGDGDEPKEAPDLNIIYPDNWCGTADFGMLDNGKIELIECHPPFACGWYGKKHEQYAEFLTLGWQYLKNTDLL
jgi:hypothetical protein